MLIGYNKQQKYLIFLSTHLIYNYKALIRWVYMELNLERDSIRYVLRRRRIKELNKSMGDLEDHLISKGSISNIEKAKGNISPKTIEIYLDKLGLSEDEVINVAEAVEEEINEYYEQLEAIEHIIDRGFPKTAKEQLSKFQLDDYHPLTPFIFYLHGRIHYEERDYKRAENKFLYAIDLSVKKYKLNPKDNIVAACYKELASCSYNQNDLNQAIKYVNLGLSKYDESKERKGIKYQLLGNKTMYLVKASQYDQVSRLLDKVWPEVEKLDNNYDDTSMLNLYKFRSIILRDQNLIEDALQCCNKGMRIARNRSNTRIGRYLDFLIISGSIYLKQKEFSKAFERFQLTLNSDIDFRSPRRHVETHTYLGVLFNSKKDWVQAAYHLEEAIRIERNNPDPFRLAKALIVRGNVHYLQNQFSEALSYYQEASRIAQKYGYKQRQYTALLKSADCFDNLDEKEKLRDCLEDMYRIQRELNIKSEAEIYEV
jgi:tetratricopeptide (TPR) repeat protein